jgi:hypothetical protein
LRHGFLTVPQQEEAFSMNEKKKQQLSDKLRTFVRQSGRKKPRGSKEPNDRGYDHDLQQIIKRMKPEELDGLLND